MKILWSGVFIAESSDVFMEGSDVYFPYDSVDKDFLQKSKVVFYCADKGYADQYDFFVQGSVLVHAAWIYPHPYADAARYKGRVGFKKHLLQ